MPGADDHEALAASIDWLIEAAERSGRTPLPARLSTVERNEIQPVLANIARKIAPCKLPADLEWFWNTWIPTSFEMVLPYPHLTTPQFALQSWTEDQYWPRPVMPIAYESHCFLAIELAYAESPGPWVFKYCYADVGFTLQAPNLATLFSATAAAHEMVADSPAPSHQDAHALIDERCREALDVHGIPIEERGPFLGDGDMLDQPERWRKAQGIDDGLLALKGATHTVAELVEACRHGELTATIVGWGRARGGAGAGRLDTVEDETGAIDVWVPSSVPNLGSPSQGHREYDVVARRHEGIGPTIDDFGGHHAEVVRRALSGDIDGAAEIGAEIGHHLHRDHPIVATAVRPVG